MFELDVRAQGFLTEFVAGSTPLLQKVAPRLLSAKRIRGFHPFGYSLSDEKRYSFKEGCLPVNPVGLSAEKAHTVLIKEFLSHENAFAIGEDRIANASDLWIQTRPNVLRCLFFEEYLYYFRTKQYFNDSLSQFFKDLHNPALSGLCLGFDEEIAILKDRAKLNATELELIASQTQSVVINGIYDGEGFILADL